MSSTDPHATGLLMQAGNPLGSAPVGMVLIHGRGDSARGILGLVPELQARGMHNVSVLAPEAVGGQWYPLRFLEPTERNEPWLSSALSVVDRSARALQQAGIPQERIVIAGFSQGACLALEYVARWGGAWGGVFGFSGGLIGDRVDSTRYSRSLAGTHAFLGCSNVDFHIPEARVLESATQLRAQGADVDARIYPNMAHTINDEELQLLAAHLQRLQPTATEASPREWDDAAWRAQLTPEQYHVLRHEGTERPYTSELNDEWRPGTYVCAGCGHKLYRADTKFDAGCGWPSFYEALPGAFETSTDFKLVVPRTEFHCANCGGHHGHVFNDGPAPTGQRYCSNGIALRFIPDEA